VKGSNSDEALKALEDVEREGKRGPRNKAK